MAILAIANGSWGRGLTQTEAELNLRKQCNSETFKKRLIYDIPNDDRPYVDEYGYIVHKPGTESILIKRYINNKEV